MAADLEHGGGISRVDYDTSSVDVCSRVVLCSRILKLLDSTEYSDTVGIKYITKHFCCLFFNNGTLWTRDR